jgi:cysteine synthase A
MAGSSLKNSTRNNRLSIKLEGELNMNILDSIGNTPLVELQHVVPPNSGRVVVKLEWANPTGSMKDRMARAAIEGAEARGDLLQGGTVVEYTGGSTGISLAFVCAAKGYKIRIVSSDAFAQEKIDMMRALGAEVQIVPGQGNGITEELIKKMIEQSRQISQQPGHWWSDQLNNRDAIHGYYPLGEEIWQQTGGKLDAFVQVVGTAHSLHGATEALWGHNPYIHIAAVEPAESAVLSGQPAGAHNIDGIGIGFTPPLWEPEKVHEIQQVSTQEAKEMARRLAREEGIFTGTSSGANVVAALRLARRLGPKATVATILVDSGLRYLSTDVFRIRG